MIHTFIYSNDPLIRFSRHVAFWVVDIINYFLVVSINTPITTGEVFGFLAKIPFLAGATYFIMYYMLPLIRKREARLHLILCGIVVIIFLGFVMRYYRFYIIGPLLDPFQNVTFNIWDPRRILAELIQASMVIGLATTIKLLKNRTLLEVHNEKLEREKKLTELSFLKAQMQPHFLFNTLNTLYSESLQHSTKAQQVVLHLSDLLRFVLEECGKPLIPVANEVKMIRDFLALERLRHGERLHVNLKLGELPSNACISPLILMPFIENSVKHSLRSRRGLIDIDIAIRIEGSRLYLDVTNPIGSETGTIVNGTGQGIRNTRNQLDLLYESQYILRTEVCDNRYHTHLVIPLNKIVHYAKDNMHYN